MPLSFQRRRQIVTGERLAKKVAGAVVKGALPTIAGITAAQESGVDLPTAAIVAPYAAIMAKRVAAGFSSKRLRRRPIKEEDMKIRQALISLSENKLEEMNKNLRQALTQKAAEMLEEKKMKMANKFFNDK